MSKVTLTIDGIQIEAQKGEKVLWAALEGGIYIPSLCAVRGLEPPFAACRLCFVEIEGRGIVTSCTETVADGMVVYTNTPRVKRLRRTAFELLLSHHDTDCSSCPGHGNCELQRIASRLGLKLRQNRFRPVPISYPIDSSHPLITYDPNRCILCGKCVWVCNERGSGVLNFAFRGIDTVVTTFFGLPLADSGCNSCLECAAVCPVGAIALKRDVRPPRS